MGELCFDGVRVAPDHVVGKVGGGLLVVSESTGWERALLMAAALGPMQRTLDEVTERSRERRQFGQPIGAFQQVSSTIADMALRVHLCRLLTYDIAGSARTRGVDADGAQGDGHDQAVHQRGLQADRAGGDALFGVRGYLVDGPIQQRLRDSLSGTIYAGTSEVMRNIIARQTGVPTA